VNKHKTFTFCLEPGCDGGFWWTVRDAERRVRGQGFSAGRRSAEQEARDAVAFLMRGVAA
jgi:hypothetical protein